MAESEFGEDGVGIDGMIERLWPAVCEVESGGKADAIGDGGRAVGIAQIWKICVDDCNRIMGHGPDSPARYDYEDRKSVAMSKVMFEVYLRFWGTQAEKQKRKIVDGGRLPEGMAPEVSLEDLARIWNGGPDGWRKESTNGYWRKVKNVLERDGDWSGGAAPEPLPGT